VIMLGSPSQSSGPAAIIYTPPASTPPHHPGPGLTTALSFPQPGTVTPATTAAEPRDVVRVGTSPPLVSTSHVMESPLPMRQESSLSEDRIHAIFRQEIQSEKGSGDNRQGCCY
jgi:hypothetical protein